MKNMKLQELLRLIHDEEARIELEVDEPGKDDYQYHRFWFSDYVSYDSIEVAGYYKDYTVVSFGFTPEQAADIQITIKP